MKEIQFLRSYFRDIEADKMTIQQTEDNSRALHNVQ